ncbi:hypothetical protein QBC38DRAFT_193962 [Podospora fimiseda]|uniref:DUF8021 domain-containing protein n=1 Tax=Podospora fimiseda TaxID=252190 RepID=A0AAN7GYT2_9PEZI|nr:hypothetical protein QBC38DRAFT_193962 [Podospora fimiseda]
MKLSLFLPLSILSSAQAACSRAALSEVSARYATAQSLAQPKYIRLLTPQTTYLENGIPLNISSSSAILSHPLKIDHSRSIHDTTTCATYTELIITDPKHYVIATQIYLDPNVTEITKIDTLVTDSDDWLFNAQHTLYYALQEHWLPIPESQQDSREIIKAAADAYLDLFEKGPGSVEVPWADDCKRLEGGLYTAPGDTCNSGVPSGVRLVNRRYIIDETVGSVDVFLNFGSEGGLHDSHEFRVEKGRIKYVHTVTVCKEFNCGFGGLPDILGEELPW